MTYLRWWHGAVLLAGLLLGLLLFHWSASPPPFRPSLPDQAAVIQWESCDQDLPRGIEARCGWFDTGQTTDSGRPIRLPLLLLRRDAEPPHAPLTIHIPGGPGAPGGTDADAAWLWSAWMLGNRFPGRLLIFDPRGTGRAEPRLSCPGRALRVSGMFARPLTPRQEAEASRAMLSDCPRWLRDDGIEPEDFAAHQLLSDIPRMIAALDEHRVRLLGLSHGSRIALALLRAWPDRFSIAVLDGVFPPDRDPVASLPEVYRQSLERLFAHCRREISCEALGLESRFQAISARLAQQPEPLYVRRPAGDLTLYWLTERRFSDVVFAAQALTPSLGELPRALVAADAGNFAPFTRLLETVLRPALDPARNDPVYWASICAEVGPLNPGQLDEAMAEAGMVGRLAPGLWRLHPCANGWGGEGLPAAFRAPVVAPHRILLIAGELDPVTPAAWAREQHQRLPDSQLLLVRGRTHGLVFSEPCVADAVTAFLRHPDAEALPAECEGPARVFQPLDD